MAKARQKKVGPRQRETGAEPPPIFGAVAKGAPCHGEFSSANASALTEVNSRIVLYGAGSTTATTLGATDQVQVTDLLLAAGASALTVTVYDGADATADAGETIAKVTLAANTTIAIPLGQPHFCQKGTWPKAKASGAGQLDITLHGTLFTY